MQIGILRETKVMESRVGLVPAACSRLVAQGHELFLEQGAGRAAGFTDLLYRDAGVNILPDAASVYAKARLIIKVKEPQEAEMALLKPHHVVFSYLHLGGDSKLAMALAETGCTAIAFETVKDETKRLPLLAPMSDIAGRLALQQGGSFLCHPSGGSGVLLGGHAGAERGRVVVIGGGVAGSSATRMAASMGAEVVVFDLNTDRLHALRAAGHNITGLYPFADQIAEQVARADLLIGAVLVPGKRAPHVVSTRMVSQMRRGSVVVDISVDQGGCIESSEPTSYENPIRIVHGVLHYGVTNMPSAVPKTASLALSTAITPYVEKLAAGDWRQDVALVEAINVEGGKVVHPAVLASIK